MARKQASQPHDNDPDSSDLVPVIFAANTKEAQFYQTLLADADIQTFIDTDVDGRSARLDKGIAVLVSAEMLDEASDIITAREELDAHILAGPEAPEFDDEEDELTGTTLDDDTAEDEDTIFRRDPFANDDDSY